MAEIIVEYQGAGFVHPYPGEYANCQVVFDSDTLTPLRVEPLGTPPPAPPKSAKKAPAPPPDTSTQPGEQASETENQGG
jgi:hypothetical protein